jgi:hypothetical protein
MSTEHQQRRTRTRNGEIVCLRFTDTDCAPYRFTKVGKTPHGTTDRKPMTNQQLMMTIFSRLLLTDCALRVILGDLAEGAAAKPATAWWRAAGLVVMGWVSVSSTAQKPYCFQTILLGYIIQHR